jgi:hypothetical protein
MQLPRLVPEASFLDASTIAAKATPVSAASYRVDGPQTGQFEVVLASLRPTAVSRRLGRVALRCVVVDDNEALQPRLRGSCLRRGSRSCCEALGRPLQRLRGFRANPRPHARRGVVGASRGALRLLAWTRDGARAGTGIAGPRRIGLRPRRADRCVARRPHLERGRRSQLGGPCVGACRHRSGGDGRAHAPARPVGPDRADAASSERHRPRRHLRGQRPRAAADNDARIPRRRAGRLRPRAELAWGRVRGMAAGWGRPEELERLGELRERGILTEQEFAAEKPRILRPRR